MYNTKPFWNLEEKYNIGVICKCVSFGKSPANIMKPSYFISLLTAVNII